jgi:predicted esterase
VPNNAATPFITCTGIYDSPHFQKGKAPFLDPDSGFFVYDAQKRPQHHMLPLRFALTIPKRYIQTGAVAQRAMPIVMYAHGTGGSYTSFISDGTARSLAQQGIAGFGIDQAVNGERTTKIGDARLDFLFFNALNYPAARDNVRQSAIDYYWQVRFLRDLSIDYNKQSFTFDHKRIWFMGHSQGGLTGPLLLAFEEHISAAYLSAPGGYLIHTLMYKIKPAEPIMLPAIVRYLICDGDDNVTPFHPILSLVQNFYDPADPVNYAAPILDGSRSPLNFLMTIGLTDSYAPPQVFDPLAVAMGLPLLGPLHHPIPGLQLRQIPQYKLPVHGNFLHPLGNRTSVGFTQHPECKYSSGGDCDGHFVAHHNPDAQRNWISFFQSLVNGDIATIH